MDLSSLNIIDAKAFFLGRTNGFFYLRLLYDALYPL
jgi:hypothetical protein